MITLVPYDERLHEQSVRALLIEYIGWDSIHLREIGYEEDVQTVVAEDLAHVDQFRPPSGKFLLALNGDSVAGFGAVRLLSPETAELKRIYVNPELRGHGIGRQLAEALITEASSLGCREIRLDTGWFMHDAQQLYEKLGFKECAPYSESEVPGDFDPRWKYMRLDLTNADP